MRLWLNPFTFGYTQITSDSRSVCRTFLFGDSETVFLGVSSEASFSDLDFLRLSGVRRSMMPFFLLRLRVSRTWPGSVLSPSRSARRFLRALRRLRARSLRLGESARVSELVLRTLPATGNGQVFLVRIHHTYNALFPRKGTPPYPLKQ